MAQEKPVWRPTFTLRLLALSYSHLRKLLKEEPFPERVEAAEVVAREVEGIGDARVVCYADSVVPENTELRQSLYFSHVVLRYLAGALAVLLFLGGFSTARAVLGSGEDPVNIFLAMSTLLAIQTASFVAWIYLLVTTAHSDNGWSFGHLVEATQRIFAYLLKRIIGRERESVLMAYLDIIQAPSVRSWYLSVMSHLGWVSFNLGAIVSVLIYFSFRQHVFGWETTVLGVEHFSTFTRIIGEVPSFLGFPTPDNQIIESTRLPTDSEILFSAGKVWAFYLVGAITTYGLLPRLLLLVLSYWKFSESLKKFRIPSGLDVDLEHRLFKRTGEITDPDPGEGRKRQLIPKTPIRSDARPIILGLEIQKPQSLWPPKVGNFEWESFSPLIYTRQDLKIAERELGALRPPLLIITLDLGDVASRGLLRSVERLMRSVGRVQIIWLLTGEGRLRQSHDGARRIETRIEQWQAAAQSFEHDYDLRVIVFDLDYTSRETLQYLETKIQVVANEFRTRPKLVDAAFRLIYKNAKEWEFPPTEKQENQMISSIRQLYGGAESLDFPSFFENAYEMAQAAAREGGRIIQDKAVGVMQKSKYDIYFRWAASIQRAIKKLNSAGVAILNLPKQFFNGPESIMKKDEMVQYCEVLNSSVFMVLLFECQGMDVTDRTAIIGAVLHEIEPLQGTAREKIDRDYELKVWLDSLQKTINLHLSDS